MAIPGYTPSEAPQDVKDYVGQVTIKSKLDTLSVLAEYLQMPYAGLSDIMDELERRCATINMPNLLLSDGTLDLGLIYPKLGEKPTTWNELKIVGHPGMSANWTKVAVGFIEGQITVFFGEYADLYILQATQPTPAELVVPKLYFSDSQGFRWSETSGIQGEAAPVATPTFVATFGTIYGETQPSNTLTFPRVVYWHSVTLEVEADAVPSYARSVRYYRLFDTTFRLVAEVKI